MSSGTVNAVKTEHHLPRMTPRQRGLLAAYLRQQAAKFRALRLPPRSDLFESEICARNLEEYAEVIEKVGVR